MMSRIDKNSLKNVKICLIKKFSKKCLLKEKSKKLNYKKYRYISLLTCSTLFELPNVLYRPNGLNVHKRISSPLFFSHSISYCIFKFFASKTSGLRSYMHKNLSNTIYLDKRRYSMYVETCSANFKRSKKKGGRGLGQIHL